MKAPAWIINVLAAIGLVKQVADAAEPLLDGDGKKRPPLPPRKHVRKPRSLDQLRADKKAGR